jgi:glycosyltransferase involved in cell wall biosynthesis
MHVLIIPSWYPRDPSDVNGSFFREQAIALNKNGCKVGVIHPELRSLRAWRSVLSGGRGIACELDQGVPTYRSRGMNWFPRTFSLAARLYIWHGLRLYERYVSQNGRPDVVHVHSLLFGGSIAAEIKRRYEVPFVVTEHSSAFARGMISRRGLAAARASCAHATRKFAVSGELAKLLDAVLGTAPPRWEYLPNAVSEGFTTYPMPEKEAKAEFRFINVGLMNENKGQASLLYAFAETLDSHPDARLTVVGDGPERNRLEELVRTLGLHGKVTFTGLLSRDMVRLEMAAADALVLSSRYETFGLVIIEALGLGKPVVSTRCGGPDSIVEGLDGILVPKDDVRSLAAAMSKMCSERNLYDASAIRASCIARFSEEAITSKLKNCYGSIALKQREQIPC